MELTWPIVRFIRKSSLVFIFEVSVIGPKRSERLRSQLRLLPAYHDHKNIVSKARTSAIPDALPLRTVFSALGLGLFGLIAREN